MKIWGQNKLECQAQRVGSLKVQLAAGYQWLPVPLGTDAGLILF